MFITLYSYKGGVGRTMALANVAYLLATDKEEQCKVLVWDFDLEGPGLQHIFHCQWKGKSQGFVDLVYKYLDSAKVPDVTDYIYQTDVPGVEILPAGKINKAYSQKLDQINWREIYAEARGYDFIQSIKEKIAAKGYDYVLVDSRTGYSDVGGICTMHLPDVVVLLFRLNDQNIHGTKKVYEAIKAYREKYSKEVKTVPVISPAWPFGALEANKQVKKTRKVFEGLKVEQISFEAALTFGEKIISRERERYPSDLRICDDYSRLVGTLRKLNFEDPLTVYRLALEKLSGQRYAEAFDLFRSLIERRPANEYYWRYLFITTQLAASRKRAAKGRELREELEIFLQKYPKNHLAYMSRAELARSEGNIEEALKLYTEAMRLSPDFVSGHLARADVYRDFGRYDKAIQDLNRAIQLDPERGDLYGLRGSCRFCLKQFEEAREDLARAIELNPSDTWLYILRARSSFLQGLNEQALAETERYISAHPPDLVDAIVLKAHILAALGRRDEAANLLGRLRSKGRKDVSDLMELAEAYLLVGDYQTALKVLDEASRFVKTARHKIIALFLQTCVLTLAGQKYDESAHKFRQLVEEQEKVAAELGWEFDTLRQSLSRTVKECRITAEASDFINGLINLLEPPMR